MSTPNSDLEKQLSKNSEYVTELRTEEVNEYEEETAHAKDDSHRDIDHGFDPLVVKKTIRQIDFRLIPILSAMYAIALIDRTNLGLARAANNRAMMPDLNLAPNNRYGVASIIFFIPYIILEVPSQLGLRKFGARTWLGLATVMWGIAMIGIGFVTNYHGLTGLRAVLGVFEAALFPGATFLISCWYPRHQMATRMAIFYSSSIAMAGLSAIFAWGVSHMHGIRGMSGWRWIFIIQGLLTVAIGVLGWIIIVDFPDKARFLSDEQRHIIVTRIERDRGDSIADKLTKAKFFKYMCDIKLWLFAYMFGITALGGYGLAFFLPAILQQMGFTNVEAQLLICPPYVFSVIPAVLGSKLSDRYRIRGPIVMFNSAMLVVGNVMFWKIDPSNKAARYVGTFFALGGATSLFPLILTWAQTSIRQQSKRGFTSALVVAWGGIGGIISGVAFFEKEAKKGYPTGMTIAISLQSSVVLIAGGLSLWFIYENRRAARGLIVLEGSPGFRYQW